MKKLDPKTDGASLDIVGNNVEKIKELFPEVFIEGKVDFTALREILGDYIDDRPERYNFTWNGKNRARRIAQMPSTGTLRPCPEESVNWDTTQNLFIEGDNLEVLKLLQKSYHKKVKMIYIDPPYNTGRDFIYPDNFRDSITNYKLLTGQVDEVGRRLSTNSDTSGRYHTNWLNMMYPRLKLARNLLRDDGVIFVSIDDHEAHNLRQLCVEIFGEENILAVIANINNPKGRSDDAFIATAHEYVLVIAKNKDNTRIWGFEPDERITRRYRKTDKKGKLYREIDLRKTGDADRRIDRPDMFYYFYYTEETNSLRVSKTIDKKDSEIEIIPLRDDGSEGRWRWGFHKANDKLFMLKARFMPVRQIWGVFEQDYIDGRPPVRATSAWTYKDVNSERGSEQFIELEFKKEVFPRPKPVGTMKRVLEIGTIPNEPAIVLDFFAGSCSIVQGLYSLVSEGRRSLQYILIQLPERLDPSNKEQKAGYDFCTNNSINPTIADIGKERIRRVIKKIETGQSEKAKKNIEKLFGMETDIPDIDLGFKVFKLDSSNIKPWDADFDNLEDSLFNAVENIKPDRSEADILYELLLKYGLDLTVPIQEKKIEGKTVYIIGGGSLIVCLADNIGLGVAEHIAALKEKMKPETIRVILRDSGFKDDVVKTNAVLILRQAGIDDVKSL